MKNQNHFRIAVMVNFLLLLFVALTAFAYPKINLNKEKFDAFNKPNNLSEIPAGLCPPPSSFPATLSVVNVACPYSVNSGSVTITLPFGSYDIDLYLGTSTGYSFLESYQLINGTVKTFDNNGNYYGPGVYYVHALQWGTLDIYEGTIEITENSQWPIHPTNLGLGGSAKGIDVKTDEFGNLYATGWFTDYFLIPSGIVHYSPFYSSGYLAKFDPCGNLLWEKQLGINVTGNCYPSALSIDPTGNIIVIGLFTDKCDFPPSGAVSLSQTGFVDNGFVSKYDPNTGNCIWAAKIKVDKIQLTMKDVTSDINNDIFILGDFAGTDLTFYDATGFANPPINNTLGGSADNDNFITVYDQNGNVIYYDHVPMSSVNNDYSGGICSGPNSNAVSTDIYITGQRNMLTPPSFLGQHYNWDPSVPSMTLTTDYRIPTFPVLNQIGTAVAIFDTPLGSRSISFSGTQQHYIGTYPFFTHQDVDLTYPPTQTLIKIDIVKDFPLFINYSTDIAVNPFSGEMYVSGLMNDYGTSPANNPAYCSHWWPNYSPNGNDMFFYTYGKSTCPVYDIFPNGGVYSETSDFISGGCDEYCSSVCANNFLGASNTAFMTGYFTGTGGGTVIGYLGNSNTFTYIPQNPGLGTDCFISRLYKVPAGSYHPKDSEILAKPILPANSVDNYLFYPNPATNTINLLTTDGNDKEVTINLLDITGKNLGSIYNGILNASPKLIFLERFSKGIYFLEFVSDNRKFTRKFVIL